jgi:hypothetical protein
VSAELVLDTATVRGFMADVEAAIAATCTPEEACEAIRPRFAELLADHALDLRPDVRLDPPADERHRLRVAARVRRRVRQARPFRSGYVDVAYD